MSTAAATTLAVLAGLLIAGQASLLGPFTRELNPWLAGVWVHVGGLVFGLAGALITGQGLGWSGMLAFPWGLLAGVAGMGIVASVAGAVTPLGLGVTLALVTGAQLLLAFLIDTTGWVGDAIPIDALRLLGAAMIVGGVLLIFR